MKGNPTAVRWIWKHTGQTRKSVFALTLTRIAASATGIWLVWELRALIDAAVSKDTGSFLHSAIILILITVFQIAIRALMSFLVEYTKSGVENSCKKQLFDTLLRKEFASVTAVHTEDWMNRLTSDTAVVADGVTAIVPDICGMTVQLILSLVLLLYLLPKLAAILIPCGILLIFITAFFRGKLKELHKEIQEADGRLRIFLSERLSSLMIVKSYGREDQASAGADKKMELFRSARMRRNRFSNICSIGFGIVTLGSYTLAALYCAKGILSGTLSYGTFTAVLELIAQVQGPFVSISGYVPKYYAMTASAERLMAAESFPEDIPEGGCPENSPHGSAEKYYQENFSGIRLDHVQFSYPVRSSGSHPSAAPVLRDVSMQISKGDIIALTGRSGCGKSTLLKLLLALYRPDRGKILFDQAPLSPLHRPFFAYVPQGNQLLAGTVRQTVAFGMNADDDAVWKALEIACAADFIRALPDGLNARLGERGSGFSEGQVQRLAIARAIYSGRPVLLLDEATSSLDEKTEADLLQNLKNLTDRTVLIVTHRPVVLRICTRQIIFTENRITERDLTK